MNRRNRNSQVGIPFVGANNDSPGFCNRKVDAGNSSFGRYELLPQVIPSGSGQKYRIGVSFGCADVLVKRLTNLFLLDMDGWQHDVAWWFVSQLDDPLAQVGVDHLDVVLFQKRIEMTFFGQHRLALDDALYAVLLKDLEDNPIVLFGIFGPMNNRSHGDCLSFKLFEILSQVCQGMRLDGGSHLSKRFPFGKRGCLAVSFLAHEPKGSIVPMARGASEVNWLAKLA